MRKRKHGKGKFEGSPADIREDKRQAKKRGMSMKQWEASPEDKAHDAAGNAGLMPGPNEFDAGAEQRMRAGARQARMAPDLDMDEM